MFGNEKKKTNHPPSHLQNGSPDPAIKILDRESIPPGHPPEVGSENVLLMGQKYSQGNSSIQKEGTEIDYGLSVKTEANVVLMEEPLPNTAKGKTHHMVIPNNLQSTVLCE